MVDVGHRGVVEGVPAHGPWRLVAPGNRPQEHDLDGSQLLEAVEDERRRARQLLDHHAGGPVELLEAVDDLAAEVEVAMAGLAEAAHECATSSHSSVHPQELISRVMMPLPVSMCVVHGMHGSKLRMARRMSMPLTWSSGTDSRIGVSTTACS